MRPISQPKAVLIANIDKTLFARKLRKYMTPAERKLWHVLRKKQCAGVRFHRQVVFDHYIVDFCAVKPRLIIEIDGPIHERRRKEDAERQKDLEEHGFIVIRFLNKEVMKDLAGVLLKITRVIGDIYAVENKYS